MRACVGSLGAGDEVEVIARGADGREPQDDALGLEEPPLELDASCFVIEVKGSCADFRRSSRFLSEHKAVRGSGSDGRG